MAHKNALLHIVFLLLLCPACIPDQSNRERCKNGDEFESGRVQDANLVCLINVANGASGRQNDGALAACAFMVLQAHECDAKSGRSNITIWFP